MIWSGANEAILSRSKKTAQEKNGNKKINQTNLALCIRQDGSSQESELVLLSEDLSKE